MKKRGLFFFIITLLFYGLILLNPLPTFSEEKALDLSPLYYKKTDDAKKSSEVRMLGPLFELKYTPEKINYGLRPLLNVEEIIGKRKEINAEFLWPLGKYSRDDKKVIKRFFPIYFSKYDTDDYGSKTGYTMLLPLYIGGEAENGKYNFFFPFYGNLKKWLNKDEIKFIGFPLYIETRKDNDRGWEILWPIFHYGKGEGRKGFKFMPFYGFDEAEGKFQKKFYFWPFYSDQKFYEGDKLSEEIFIMFPFYGYARTEERDFGTIMFPLYMYDYNKKRNYSRHDYLWPIISTTSGEARQVRQFFPLYRLDKSEDITHNFFLWPFIWYNRMAVDGYEKEDKYFVPIFTDKKETWSEENKSARRINLWPLLSYRRDKEDRTEISSLSLLPFTGPGPLIDKLEKNFSPLWTFYKYESDKEGNSGTALLWSLFKYEKRNDGRTIKIPLLFSYESDEKGKGFSILNGLIERRKKDDKNRLKVFYIPLN